MTNGRRPTVADLADYDDTLMGPISHRVTMQLYCWPCQTVHEFSLADVERIVYLLAEDARDIYQAGWDARETPERSAVGPKGKVPLPPPYARGVPCLLEMIDWYANDEETASEIDQRIECRERTDG